jgi:hypothetical protein
MVREIRFIPLILLLAGCNTTSSEPEQAAPIGVATAALSPPTIPTAAILDALKATAAKSFKDPYSAKWERLQQATRPNVRGEPTDVVCGYVNAKNSYGAYIGPKPFVYFIARQNLQVAGADDTLGVVPDILKTFCTGLI